MPNTRGFTGQQKYSCSSQTFNFITNVQISLQLNLKVQGAAAVKHRFFIHLSEGGVFWVHRGRPQGCSPKKHSRELELDPNFTLFILYRLQWSGHVAGHNSYQATSIP